MREATRDNKSKHQLTHTYAMVSLSSSTARNSTFFSYLTLFALALSLSTSSSLQSNARYPHPRSTFLRDISKAVCFGIGSTANTAISMASTLNGDQLTREIIYEPISVEVLGEQVPVAAWYPSTINGLASNANQILSKRVTYEHRISVQKIGKSLANLNFIPSFTTRRFSISPDSRNIVQLSSKSNVAPNFASCSLPVVLLAHGYLGSRFDLSPYAEDLAAEGFLVLSCEYPESLADSYDSTTKPIDRTIITSKLLNALSTWNVDVQSYSIIGHSLGCGTANNTGDDSWTRVCIAGFPSTGSKCLFIGSTNDGAVPLTRATDTLQSLNYVQLNERKARFQEWKKLSPRTSLIFNEVYNNNPPPNHISFLSEGTNAAMVDFLSPLLPAARYLGIPVLDFDKYQLTRDSDATGKIVRPLVVDYLRQMNLR